MTGTQQIPLIEQLPRTSSVTINRLKKAGIVTWFDLLQLPPNRYVDFSRDLGGCLEPDVAGTLIGTIQRVKNHFSRNGTSIQKITIQPDNSSNERELVWFNQMFLTKTLKTGMRIATAGTFKQFQTNFTLEVQEYEILNPEKILEPLHTLRIVPYHPQISGISAKTLREKMHYVCQQFDFTLLPDPIPLPIRSENELIPYHTALKHIHFPSEMAEVHRARETLAFYELFKRLSSSSQVKREWKEQKKTHAFSYNTDIQKRKENWQKLLPFSLTGAQKKAIAEIDFDLQKTTPMNRFLQGDVGSGKTVVAASAAYTAALNGFQTLYMAPTEILAQQHFKTFTSLFQDAHISLRLVTGTTNAKKKPDAMFTEDILVGTQALLTESVYPPKTGLVIIDEQHRFGVRQRSLLKQKGNNPHLLTMTATPIPRTISLVLFGELDITTLEEMPTGRKPIKTYVVPPHKRSDAYRWIEETIKKTGSQAYIICPLIDTSDSETMKSVRAASQEYEYLARDIFPHLSLALLHGKCKPAEKEQIMSDFHAKKYDILIATSVVEVGVDVPNATIMIIEGAERFGLAQLHQLRGRVGRGDAQSYCLLFTTDDTTSQKRLQFFSRTNNGLQLAEYDLKLRGPGEVYGTTQHGFGDFKLADITNFSFVARVQQAVQKAIKIQDPQRADNTPPSHVSRD